MKFRNPFKNAEIIGKKVSARDYLGLKFKRGDKRFVMSRSSLMDFAKCPFKWRYLEDDKDDTKSTIWGSLVDCLLFTPELFEDEYVVRPDAYPDSKGKMNEWTLKANYCKDWEAMHADKTVIRSKVLNDAKKAVAVIQNDKYCKPLLAQSDFQVWIKATYVDVETKVEIPVQCLIDIMPNDLSKFRSELADLKTAVDATPQKWARKVFEFDYNVQAAFELDLVNAATGSEREGFRHIIQESEAPYAVGRRIMAHEFLESGRSSYLNALRLYAVCLLNDEWPSYDDNQSGLDDGWSITYPESWMIKELANSILTSTNSYRVSDDYIAALAMTT